MLKKSYCIIVGVFVIAMCSVVIPANALEFNSIDYWMMDEVHLEKANSFQQTIDSNINECARVDQDFIEKNQKKIANVNDRSIDNITAGFSINSNNSTHDQRVEVEVGVWLYANFFDDIIPISIVDRLKSLGINTIYFAGTTVSDWQHQKKAEAYRNFICYAYSSGLNVYGVTLEDPFFTFEKEAQLREEFSEFIDVTKRYFKAYMIDVEPHVIHFGDPLVYVPQYIRMSLILQQVSNDHNITYVDTVPFWYHYVIKDIGISAGVDILGGNRVNLMDYSYTFNQSISNIAKIVSDIKKPHTISIKVTPGYGDPFLNQIELERTIDYLQNHSISYAMFESRYLLRNNS